MHANSRQDRIALSRLFHWDKFPVSVILFAQYWFLVVLQGVWHGNPDLRFLMVVTFVGVLGAFSVEFLLAPLRPSYTVECGATSHGSEDRDSELPPAFLYLLVLVGGGSTILSAVLQPAYQFQVAGTAVSPLIQLLTPLQPWLLLGGVYSLFSYGSPSKAVRVRGLALLAMALLFQLMASVLNAITAPLFSLAVTLIATAALYGLLALRKVVLLALLLALVFPALAGARDEVRSQSLDGGQSLEFRPLSDRLREDVHLADARPLLESSRLVQPSFGQALRVGLIPRYVDRAQPTLAGGRNLSAALGRSPLTSSTVTIFGSVLVAEGWAALFAYSALVALLSNLLSRRRGLHSLPMLSVVIYYGLIIERTYPDAIAGMIQGLISLAMALVLLAALRFVTQRSTPQGIDGVGSLRR
jgi:multisubunit Na+/H+ antiporter MnhB subunit